MDLTTERLIKKLEIALKNSIKGEVRFDHGSKALYATDGSNYRQIPIGVVIPKSKEDVIQTVRLCHAYKAPLLSRGGGTSLAGQCCNEAVVMDMSKYFNRIIKIDPDQKYAIVEPGVVRDQLEKEVHKYQLTFGPDPATHAYCTLGGMIGNNSCGTHSIMAGKTDDNVLELEILTYDGLHLTVGPTSPDELEKKIAQGGREGEIYSKLKELVEKYGSLIEEKYPNIPRRVSGYNLPWLLQKNGCDVAKALVGSESTCVIVLEAKVRLLHSPPNRSVVVLGYPDVYTAGDHVPEIMEHHPIALEGLDDLLIENMRKKHLHQEDLHLLPEGKGWLIVQFGGETQKEASGKGERLIEALKRAPYSPTMKFYADPELAAKIFAIRESGVAAASEKESWAGWEDSAVPPEKVGKYLRDLRELLKKYDYGCSLYGHFGQGCIHTRIDFDLYTTEGLNKYLSFIHEAADLVMTYGGSFSGEHGDGQSRGELLPKMFGEELMQAFRDFKALWDPEWKMNPGKMIDAYSPIENLRLGPNYSPQSVKTHFKFPDDDEGSFAKATLRCIGVGKCRRPEEGTMCPSYMVTKEERHSTRGRARLLFEMLQGEVIGKKTWKDESVKEALDLCLSCKGCKSDCPMNVDMATYKAEFLSHYYEGKIRPRSAYAFGLIYWWARLATRMPKIANFFTQTPLAKWVAGAPQERSIPLFAKQNFKTWFFKREKPPSSTKTKVILWADTFNNHFHPHIAQAAVEVLEHLGFEVTVPKISLCCGRPLYDYGMLTLAKRLLQKILTEMKEEIEEGTPIIGLEPSCVSVFRDELLNLFPSDINAKKLQDQVFLLSEFIQKFVPDYPFPPLPIKALVHGHCHHKSVLKFQDEKELLHRLRIDFQILDSGCCGMAGGFGFEKDHYDVSIKAAERVLLPKIREATPETIIITNGFSCNGQVEHSLGRQPLHIAEILKMSLEKMDQAF